MALELEILNPGQENTLKSLPQRMVRWLLQDGLKLYKVQRYAWQGTPIEGVELQVLRASFSNVL